MKVFNIIMCLIVMGTVFASRGDAAEKDAPSVLVAYFSHTNNTRRMAEAIHAYTGGVLYPIVPRTPYPREHRETERVSRHELDNNLRPELASTISPEEMASFDIIFVGFPNWWNTMPMVMATFLDQYDLTGKTIVPFCTHGGSGLGSSTQTLSRLIPNAAMLPGLAVHQKNLDSLDIEITAWLKKIGLLP